CGGEVRRVVYLVEEGGAWGWGGSCVGVFVEWVGGEWAFLLRGTGCGRRNGSWAVYRQYMAGAIRETKFSDGKCWLGRRNGSWAAYRRYMGGAVRRFNSLTVNAGSGGLGGYYEVASVGRIGRK